MKKSLIIFGLVILLVIVIGFISVGIYSRITGNVVEGVGCSDSDGGSNVAEKGTTTWGPIAGKDYNAEDGCDAVGEILSEQYCYYSSGLKGDYSGVNYYTCLYGCEGGACILSEEESAVCTDSDNGRDYFVKGTTESTITFGGTDECWGTFVKEYYCDENGGSPNPTNYDCSVVCCEQYEFGDNKIDVNNYEEISFVYSWMNKGSCSARESLIMDEEWENEKVGRRPVDDDYCEGEKPLYSCENGACVLGTSQASVSSKELIEEGVEEPELSIEEEQASSQSSAEGLEQEKEIEEELSEESCDSGCVLDEECYSFGYRKSGKFCADTGEFVEQLEEDLVCENNFECYSNICVNGKCISGNLFQRFINWFKKFFGGE